MNSLENGYDKLNSQTKQEKFDSLNSTDTETFDAELFAEENADWMDTNTQSKFNFNSEHTQHTDEMIEGAIDDNDFTKDVDKKLRETLAQKWTLATRLGNPNLYRFAKAHSKEMLAIGSEAQQQLLKDMLTAKRAAMNLLIASKLQRAAATMNRQTKEWVLNELNKAHEALRYAEKSFLQMIEEDLKYARGLSPSSRQVYEKYLWDKRTNQLKAFEDEAIYTEHAMSVINKISGVK